MTVYDLDVPGCTRIVWGTPTKGKNRRATIDRAFQVLPVVILPAGNPRSTSRHSLRHVLLPSPGEAVRIMQSGFIRLAARANASKVTASPNTGT
jgi:hypothetical protein